MKYFVIPLLAGAVLCCTQAPAQKLEHKEHVSKEFTISTGQAAKNVLAIYNINGFIKVEGYNGDKVVLEIDKKIREARKAMEKAAKDLDFMQAAKWRDEIKALEERVKAQF